MLTTLTALQKNLDVFFFVQPEERTRFAQNMTEQTERTCEEFSETVAGFVLLCLAVSPRPSSFTKFGL